MSPHLPPAAAAFLTDLAENNEREWFHANKARYETALKQPLRDLAAALSEGLGALAPEHEHPAPHKAVNRIHRDLRFSKDKRPYHTHCWMGFPHQGLPKGAAPTFYFGFDAAGWGVGAGLWKPQGPVLRRIRAHVAEHHDQLRDILEAPDFATTFGSLRGDQLKRVPRPWTADHPAAALLRHKDVHVRHEGDPALLHSPALVDTVLGHFTQLAPLVDFLAQAVQRPET